MSRAQALMMGSTEDVRIGDRSVVRIAASGTLTSTFTLNLDGNQYANTDSSTNTTSSKGYWVSPSASAGNYECKATLTSGAVTTGDTTGSWLALTSSRTWTVTRSINGVSTGVLSISIRRAGVGSALVTSAITLEVDNG